MRADDPQEPVGGTKALDVHLTARTRGQLYQLAKAEMQVLAEAVAVDPAQSLHAGRLVAGEEERVADQCGRREVAIDRLAAPAGKLAGEEQLDLVNGLVVGQRIAPADPQGTRKPAGGLPTRSRGPRPSAQPKPKFSRALQLTNTRQSALGQDSVSR